MESERIVTISIYQLKAGILTCQFAVAPVATAEAISKELLHTFSLTLKQVWHPKNAQIHCSQPWWTHGPLAVLKWTQPQRKPMSLQVLGEDGSLRQLQIIQPVWKPPACNRRILSLQRSQIFWWRGWSSHHSSTTHPVWA